LGHLRRLPGPAALCYHSAENFAAAAQLNTPTVVHTTTYLLCVCLTSSSVPSLLAIIIALLSSHRVARSLGDNLKYRNGKSTLGRNSFTNSFSIVIRVQSEWFQFDLVEKQANSTLGRHHDRLLLSPSSFRMLLRPAVGRSGWYSTVAAALLRRSGQCSTPLRSFSVFSLWSSG